MSRIAITRNRTNPLMRIFPALALISVTAWLGACATVPEPLRGEFPSGTPQLIANQNTANQRVRWGGQIIDTRPGKNETCFELIGWALSDIARPQPGNGAQGRFIACAPGFFDPEVYGKGREVTVVGLLGSAETRKIGDYDYRYPRVTADQVYLWPEREEYEDGYYPYYYDPFFYPGFSHRYYRRPISVPPGNNPPSPPSPTLPTFPRPPIDFPRPSPPPAPPSFPGLPSFPGGGLPTPGLPR